MPGLGEGEWIPVRIRRDHLNLPHPNGRYSDWFSSFLGISCRLVYLPAEVSRYVEPPFHDGKWRVSLADAYPLLVVTEESLTFLNSKLASRIGMERFRPNLVIAGATPHSEDSWKDLQIGSVRLGIVKPCARCSTVLVDPTTAKLQHEPLRTLAAYRRMPRRVMFAQNALVLTSGSLRVGTAVETAGLTIES
ncbi:MAG: MOSC domain-containing protein [Bryobacteraceae bacterium]